MITDRRQLAQEALIASSKIRKRYKFDMSSPLSMFDLADEAGVPVRFVNINMEGMYVHIGEGIKPTILISALRPFHRKVFTCAHEYGHHYFGHGLTVDEILSSDGSYNKNEFLVDTFASYLLMPPLGIKKAFSLRQLTFETATALDCFAIACSFGVGYSTFINHLKFNGHISHEQASCLLKQQPKKIKEFITGRNTPESVFFVDEHFLNKTIDVETTGYIVLPKDVVVEEKKYLKFCKELEHGALYQVLIPGFTRIYSNSRNWHCFLRIQTFQYIGLAKYRHLSD